LILSPGGSAAEERADDIGRLRASLLREIRVTRTDGVTETGVLRSTEGGELLLVGAHGEFRVPIESAQRIQRRGDSVRNGALLGLAYGVFSMTYVGQGANTSEEARVLTLIAPVAWTLIGITIDAFHHGWTTVYRRSKRPKRDR
jgi:hypothetical protein